jgi:hypothetical protein
VTSDDREAAISAVETWLKLLDSGKFRASWESASDLLRKRVSEDRWREVIRSVRESLGTVNGRKLLKVRYAHTLPGVPPGDYLVMEFSTKFAEKPDAIETVTPVRTEDNTWKVYGYYVR